MPEKQWVVRTEGKGGYLVQTFSDTESLMVALRFHGKARVEYHDKPDFSSDWKISWKDTDGIR